MSEPIPDPADPRIARPLVAGPTNSRGIWVFGVAAALAAAALFAALEARRSDRGADPLKPTQVQGGGMIVPPPPLALDDPGAVQSDTLATALWPQQPQIVVAPPSSAPRRTTRSPQVLYAPGPPVFQPPPQPGPIMTDPVYQGPPPPTAPAPEAASNNPDRVKAARFSNPGTTIPQGAVIQAVLETALDSTRPGPARALVSRDVRSFDGTRVLVPRGSRLYGDYKADLAVGQNRAMIQWTRLMRPDGVVIALDSPSADPLGRAGVKGKVNTHFLARFGNALMQSILDFGVSYGTSKAAGGTVVLGLPGSSVKINPTQTEVFEPTLRVPQGSPVSVFVARDLDFSDVER